MMPQVQLWMVEQWWKVGDAVVPIRSVVRAMTKRKARERAADACRDAATQMADEYGADPGTPDGKATVLYPVG